MLTSHGEHVVAIITMRCLCVSCVLIIVRSDQGALCLPRLRLLYRQYNFASMEILSYILYLRGTLV